MPECLRVHLADGAFVDLPPDVGCSESAVGSLLFHWPDGRVHSWYRAGLVERIERVQVVAGVTVVGTPWPG